MPEQETTKLYLVSSLLIDVASKVLTKTLNGVCTRINKAFEPLLNLNLHSFFHKWKSQPCCQCDGKPVENSPVTLRDGDWVRLYQQVRSPCQHKDECSCCYRAYCGIQPSSIDYALATKVLIGLKALSEREFVIVSQLRNFEPELKQIQEKRIENSAMAMLPIKERSRWREILSTLEQLAKEIGNGYWENLKEAKELSRILSELDNNTIEDDSDFRDDKDDQSEAEKEEETVLTEEHTPKDEKSSYCTDSNYFTLSDKSDKLYDEKVDEDKTDADSGYPDNMSFRSPRDFHDDEEYEKLRYHEGSLHPLYEEFTEKESQKDDPLILENRHGLTIQQMKAQSQALARRCYNLSKDTAELLRSRGLSTKEFKIPESSPMNDYKGSRTSSWVSDTWNKYHERQKLGRPFHSSRNDNTHLSSSKESFTYSIRSRDVSPISATPDTGGYGQSRVDQRDDVTDTSTYNVKAEADTTKSRNKRYDKKKQTPLIHHVRFSFDSETTRRYDRDVTDYHCDNVDSSYPGHRKVPLSNEEFTKLIDESYKCLVRSRATLRSTSPLDAKSDFIHTSSAREFTRWFDARNSEEPRYDTTYEEGVEPPLADINHEVSSLATKPEAKNEVPTSRYQTQDYTQSNFSPYRDDVDEIGEGMTLHSIVDPKLLSKGKDYQPTQTSSLRDLSNYRTSRDGERLTYKGSDFYRKSVQQCEQIRRRSASIRHELERGRVKLKAINRRDDTLMQSCDSLASFNDTEYAADEPYEVSKPYEREVKEYPSEETYFTRNTRSIHSMPNTRRESYTDKYEKWLNESVQRVNREKYGGTAATKNFSDSMESLYEEDFQPLPDYRNRYSSTPTLSARVFHRRPEANHDDEDEFLVLPNVSSVHVLPQFSPITTFPGNEGFTKQSNDDSIEMELEELKEEKSFGSFLSKSRESLLAMRERNQRTRKEIERVRFQLHSSGM